MKKVNVEKTKQVRGGFFVGVIIAGVVIGVAAMTAAFASCQVRSSAAS